MRVQETREVVVPDLNMIKNDKTWFRPQALYLLLGMVVLIALIAMLVAPSGKRDANDIISPWDASLAPPQIPDRTAVVIESKPQASPASQGAGAKALSKGSGGKRTAAR